jgi:hypothetical protein
MQDYKTAAASLPEAMRPLRDYCARQRTKSDLSGYAFKHIKGAMEALITDYLNLKAGELLPVHHFSR